MLLVIDNRDSFTFNLVQAFAQLGEEVEVLRADRGDLPRVRALAPDRIVIGPGPGRPEAAQLSMELMGDEALELPLLGVCLGHQALACAHGGSIAPARTLAHGQTTEVTHAGSELFARLPNPARFTRYNSLVVDETSLPTSLEVTARAEDGDVMGLRHRSRPVWSVQFHPEAILSEGGQVLCANFLALARSASADATN